MLTYYLKYTNIINVTLIIQDIKMQSIYQMTVEELKNWNEKINEKMVKYQHSPVDMEQLWELKRRVQNQIKLREMGL